MTLEELEKEIAAANARRQELFNLKEPIDNELVSNYEKLEQLKQERTKLLLPQKENDWVWLLEETGSGGDQVKLRAICNKIESMGLYCSGYNPKTEQRAIKLMLTKNDEESYTQTIASLEILLPYIKADPEDGYKYFGIFETSLSAGGVFYLRIGEKNSILGRTVYGHDREIKTFLTVAEAVKYIQENHWYKKIKRKERK